MGVLKLIVNVPNVPDSDALLPAFKLMVGEELVLTFPVNGLVRL